MTLEQEERVVSALGIAGYVAKRHAPPSEQDDVRSAIIEALCRAAASYDPSKGTWTTFAFNHARWALSRYFRHAPEPVVSLDSTIEGAGITREVSLLDITPDPRQVPEVNVLDRVELDACIDAIQDPRRRYVFKRRLGDRATLAEIGRELHVSAEWVRMLEERAIAEARLAGRL